MRDVSCVMCHVSVMMNALSREAAGASEAHKKSLLVIQQACAAAFRL